MKNIIYTLVLIAFISCGKKKSFTENASSLQNVKKVLISKFGGEAFYTSISLSNSRTSSGDLLSVTQTKDPSSLQMEDWAYLDGKWTQSSEITLELSEGAKAEDFMFQLDESIVKFDLLGKLVEQSKQKIIEEKKIDDVIVESIFINAPNNGDFSTMEYYIIIKPKNGGTGFDFHYKMDGTLLKSDY